LILSGNPNATTIWTELQAVVVALKLVPNEFAHGKGKMSMSTPILKRDRRTIFFSIENNWLVHDRTRQGLSTNLRFRGGYVPMVPQKHGQIFPSGSLWMIYTSIWNEITSRLSLFVVLFVAATHNMFHMEQ
jgi:hypothetical protein